MRRYPHWARCRGGNQLFLMLIALLFMSNLVPPDANHVISAVHD